MTSERPSWGLGPIDITTSQMRIRAFTEFDIGPEYLAWLNDKHHMRYSNQRFYHHSRDSALAYLDEFKAGSSVFLALTLHGSGELVGTATVFASSEHGTADIGILIAPTVTRRQLGRESVGALAQHLLGLGFRKVTIGTSAANAAMLRVIEAVGFVPDGARRRQELVEGTETDVLYFALFAPA